MSLGDLKDGKWMVEGLSGSVGRLMRGDEVEVRPLDDVRGVKEVMEIIRMSIRR